MKIYFYFSCVFLCLSSFANACSCVDQKIPLNETLAKTDVVFTGKVVKKSKEKWIGNNFYDVEFQLIENYKGKRESNLIVKTSMDDGTCGFPFEEGETYLVFAYKYSADDKENSGAKPQYATGICSRTKAIKFADADLKELNEIKKSAK